MNAPFSDRAADHHAMQGDTAEFVAVSQTPVVPGYELSDKLSEDDRHVVYRARDLALGQDAAVKFPHQPGSGAVVAARFVEGLRILARIQHPGVPPLFYLGALPDGRPYVVMKLVEGDRLSDVLSSRPTAGSDRARSIALFEKVCRVLAHAHAQKVLHLGLSSRAVMIDAFGEVQVLGWGDVSVSGELASSVRRPDATILGRPRLMAPEMARGDWASVDARADVFALGGMLFEILVGRSCDPFPLATGNATETYARLDALDDEPSLVVLARRCLSPDPGQRPADAAEVLRLIVAYREVVRTPPAPTSAEPAKSLSEGLATGRERQLKMALLLVCGMFVVWIGVFLWWQERKNVAKDYLDRQPEPPVKSSPPPPQPRPRDPAREQRMREIRDRLLKGPPPPSIPAAPQPREGGQPSPPE